jgi:fructose-1,6-bisphosphatase/inositol monophosphatase family enzyme
MTFDRIDLGISPDLDIDKFLRQLAIMASIEIYKARIENDFTSEVKGRLSDGSLDMFTSVDTGVQTLITQQIQNKYPHATIIGEEGARVQASETNDMIWTIDPIDGTGAFIRGELEVTVMIAVVVAGSLTASIIANPFTFELIQKHFAQDRVSCSHTIDSKIPELDRPIDLRFIPPIELKKLSGFNDPRSLTIGDKSIIDTEIGFWKYFFVEGSYGQLVNNLITNRIAGVLLEPTTVKPWDALPGAIMLSTMGYKRYQLIETAAAPNELRWVQSDIPLLLKTK